MGVDWDENDLGIIVSSIDPFLNTLLGGSENHIIHSIKTTTSIDSIASLK